MTARSIRTKQGDTVDMVALRCYGDTAMTVAIMEANPGLADLGAILPHGTMIALPEKTIAAKPATISLWD